MKQPDSLRDIAKNPGQPLAQINPLEQIPLPPPFDNLDEEPPLLPGYADWNFIKVYANYDPLGRYIFGSFQFNF